MRHSDPAAGLLAILLAIAGAAPLAADEPESSSDHWAYRRPQRPAVPATGDELPSSRSFVARRPSGLNDGPATPIDAFILHRLRQAELAPVPPAGRRTLLRRMSFDLTGLPPTRDELHDFLADFEPDAWSRALDRSLASPHYGERWAQHWLDVVRFAETEGFEYDAHIPGAWRFRDYVIDALNADLPYDRFVTEQLAGDELADLASRERPRPNLPANDATGDARLLASAGFHRLGPVRRNAGNAEVAFSRNEVLTERTDIIGAAFLGMTVGCARCHDHMFDPFPQRDYYRLQAFLGATFASDVSLASADEQSRWKAAHDELDREADQIKAALKTAAGAEEERLTEQLEQLAAKRPAPLPSIATVANDSRQETAIHVLVRGDESRKAERVAMRPPGVLLAAVDPVAGEEALPPRLRLSRWLTDADNPLPARVIVNRLWQHHFGTGLVDTPNDFGLNGNPPSHPELLDWLAVEFVQGPGSMVEGRSVGDVSRPAGLGLSTLDHGPHWSIKRLHRLILHSAVYQQASRSDIDERAHDVDPGNRLLWRFPRRRLDAEQIRDAMLAVSGRLNRKAGGPSVMIPVDPQLVDLLYKPSQWAVTPDPREHDRRSVYLIFKRNLRPPLLEVFDQPDLQTSCFRRQRSTHAPQALELLNGDASNRLAEAFAERLLREAGDDPRRQIEHAWLLAAGRPPTDDERSLALEFLETAPLREFALALFNLNVFLYVE